MNRLHAVCVAMALVAAPSPLLAQQAPPVAVARTADAATLDAAQRLAAIADIRQAVQAHYVFPDRIATVLARLDAGLASGRYDRENPAAFVEAVTADLRESSQDRHMYLTYDPAGYAASRVQGVDGASDKKAFEALRARAAVRAHYGLAETAILPGNVRYLRIRQFAWVHDQAGAAYDASMAFLAGGDAIIIDLRDNGGGWHDAVRYLLSHFMEPDTLDITFVHTGEASEQSRTLSYLPAGRLTGKPLYVLINGGVGSAAEAFAYDVRQFHLGTLVGATTAGAANNNEFFPVAPAFMVSVSTGRPVHPVSGTNWDGVGVAPDVAVSPDRALDTAQALALTTLMTRTDADPADQADWAWARPGVEARLHPVVVPAATLRSWVGTYGGRRIALRDAALFWMRSNGQAARLIPLTADGLFTVEGFDDHMHLRLGGDALEMQWIDEPAPMRLSRDPG